MNRLFDPVTLRLFVAVCEERNIGRAATREALVASAVSKRIGSIEQQLGTPLLVRGSRGIEPTPAGQTLLRQAREVLGAMERMHAELSEFASGVQGSLRMVASASALAESLPDDVSLFLARHSALRVSLSERVGNDVVGEVREGAADLGVVWDTVDTRGLQSEPYRCDHLAVVMPPSHPLRVSERIRFSDTLEHPSVGVSPGGLLDGLLRRHAALLGRTLNQQMQVSSLDAGIRIVAAGLGLGILPLEAAAPWLASARLITRALDEPWAERRFVIVSRADEWLSIAGRLLFAHLRDTAATAGAQTQPAA